MSPPAALDWLGRNARAILPAGFVAAALLPPSGGLLAPMLPWLVAALIAMTFARVDLRPLLADLLYPRSSAVVVGALLIFQPALAFLLSLVGQAVGLPPPVVLALVVFAAAPPLSSAPALALMLGYDARLALRLMLTGTLISPLTIPVSFWLADLDGSLPLDLALRTGVMLAGGLATGLVLRRIVGPGVISAQAGVFDGLATALMLMFLLPLVDGLAARVSAAPVLALALGATAFLLNFGGNILMRTLLRGSVAPQAAASIGLVFGNRNASVILAALPDPTIALFVGLAQAPIYLNPLFLGLYDKVLTRWRRSSEF